MATVVLGRPPNAADVSEYHVADLWYDTRDLKYGIDFGKIAECFAVPQPKFVEVEARSHPRRA